MHEICTKAANPMQETARMQIRKKRVVEKGYIKVCNLAVTPISHPQK